MTIQRAAALFCALGATIALAACDSPNTVATTTPTIPAANTQAAINLKQDMRKLWTDHVVWTRDYIIAAVAHAPDAKAAADRLMKNQEQLGDAIAKYYGDKAGEHLTTLLKEHISQAVEVIRAAQSNNKAVLTAANDRWRKNAEEIADFLSQANPGNWPKSDLSGMMKEHLSTTTDEVEARLKQDWARDAKAFDAVYNHILTMADALSDGIIKQFPSKFAPEVR